MPKIKDIFENMNSQSKPYDATKKTNEFRKILPKTTLNSASNKIIASSANSNVNLNSKSALSLKTEGLFDGIVTEHRGHYFDFSKRHVSRTNNEIQQVVQTVNAVYFNNLGLEITNMKLNKKDDELIKTRFKIVYNKQTEEEENFEREKIRFESAIKASFVKDKTHLSDFFYHYFCHSLSLNIPNINIIKEIRERFNKMFQIFTNNKGAYIKVETKLHFLVEFYLHANIMKEGETIIVKLCGDGFTVCKTTKFLNISISIINEGNNAKSVNGHYLIGLFKVDSESYDEIKDSLAQLLKELKVLKSLTVKGKKFHIKFKLGGDMKFLLLVLGLNGPTAVFNCLYCTEPKNSYYKRIFGLSFPITRSIAACNSGGYGYIRMPIIDFIDFSDVVFDPLHMFLRVSDVLFESLIHQIKKIDNKNGVNLEEQPYLNKFFNVLTNHCNISNPFYIAENNIQLRDLNGLDKKIAMQNLIDLDIGKLFPNIKNASIINIIWKDFYDIINKLKEDSINTEEIEFRTRDWLNTFYTYMPDNITPYIHIFSAHLHQIIQSHLDLDIYNTEGLEKLNDIIKCAYKHASNRNKVKCVVQIFKWINRREIINKW